MTIQAFLFLRKVRRVQTSEDSEVQINDERKCLISCDPSSKKHKPMKLKSGYSELLPMLNYLEKNGYIRKSMFQCIALTYKGYHYQQSIVSGVCRFFLNSIVVPIVVSVITTLVTLLLTALFK